MLTGKLDYKTMERYVFSRIGFKHKEVLQGPGIGADAAIIDMGDRVLVVHSDPITEAVERLGWLAVNIACNDIAVRGAKPLWVSTTILLPEGFSETLLDTITKDMDRAAKELGVMIIGGHTEETPRLDRPLVNVTAIGIASKRTLVLTSGARAGDYIVMTKTAGLEGTGIIARDFEKELIKRKVPKNIIDRAKEFTWRVSVVREALLFAWLGATSMHDPTEGGLIGGLVEISIASKRKLVVYEDKIPVAEETKVIANALGLDPLKLISSGVLLAIIPSDNIERVLEIARNSGVSATVIGRVEEGYGVELIRRDGSKEYYKDFVVDEITKLW